MKKIALFVFCFFLLKGYGQNLVSNPSFETLSQCPWGSTQIFLASPWFQPCIHSGNSTNSSSSDIFNSCDSNGYVGVPVNVAGYGFQNTHTGDGYAGIYGGMDSTENAREYIESPLQSPLVANRKYCIEFYVSLANFSQYAISNMGAYLSVGSLLDTSYFQPLEYMVSPQIENSNGNYLNDTLNWMLVSGNFIASGGEDHITIGNFRTIANTSFQNLAWGSYYLAYYYIDDVSVVDCTAIGVDETENKETINLYPNPTTGTMKLEYPLEGNTTALFSIYEPSGRLVLKQKITNTTTTIDANQLNAGMYYYSIASGTKNTKAEKLVIVK